MSRALLAAVLLTTISCGGGSGDTEAVVVDDGLAVLDAWTRPSPPGADEAAIYVTVENRDAPDDRLIGAESDRCTVVTPHLTEIDDQDVARMAEADDDQLGLSAGERVVMEPTGLHLMCLGLASALADGDSFEVVLRFSSHDPVVTPVVVTQR